MEELLNNLYPNRIKVPESIVDLPENDFMVYILTYNGTPIVLGHGKRNRARVIFDDIHTITSNHIKALFVRLYKLFGNGTFDRYIVTCRSKDDAKQVENNLHYQIGGNNRNLPKDIRNQLVNNFPPDSIALLLLEIALRSSFDGLADLRKWRNDGLINDDIWQQISERLRLN
jgi:hypothetical protein